jgi:hypothetical protein
MNRRQRRAAGIRTPLATLVACPDCDSDVRVVQLALRVYRAEIAHDDTCPWFAAFKRSGGVGVRLIREEDSR